MTFLLCLATLLLCLIGAKTGIKVISDYQTHWNFSLKDLWDCEDSALTYATVAASTGACIGLALMLAAWVFTQQNLAGIEKTVWAMNHFATASSIVGFHHMAARYLRRHIRDSKVD